MPEVRRPSLEVADIFAAHGKAYDQQHPMTAPQRRRVATSMETAPPRDSPKHTMVAGSVPRATARRLVEGGHCRAAWVARKMLPVPPDVRWPVAAASPPRRWRTIATTSASMRRRLGNTRSPRPFSVMKSA